MSGFLDMSGSDLKTGSFTAVIRNKTAENEWVVQNVFSKYNVDTETAVSGEFGSYLVCFERVGSSIMTANEVKLLNHKMENQREG